MKNLYPSFSDPNTWRTNIQERITKDEWRNLRQRILRRDDNRCKYCGYQAHKWQIVHHIDGNPNNNRESNLETVCPMCNLINHAGQGCIIQGIVDLYKKSRFSQNEIIQITRALRSKRKSDKEIIRFLGLREKAPFKMKKSYLRRLFGFVTSRKTNQEWTQKSLEYGYRVPLEMDVVLKNLEKMKLSRWC